MVKLIFSPFPGSCRSPLSIQCQCFRSSPLNSLPPNPNKHCSVSVRQSPLLAACLEGQIGLIIQLYSVICKREARKAHHHITNHTSKYVYLCIILCSVCLSTGRRRIKNIQSSFTVLYFVFNNKFSVNARLSDQTTSQEPKTFRLMQNK